MANLSARDNDIYRSNIIALEKAKPKPLKAADIDVSIGATWISPKYYEQFMYEIFKTPEENRSDYAPKYYWQKMVRRLKQNIQLIPADGALVINLLTSLSP